MSAAMSRPFLKMNGLGNEFAVFDGRSGPIRLSAEAIRKLGQPNAIGFDQMITLERPKAAADVFMRIHNRDGGEVERDDAPGGAEPLHQRLPRMEAGVGAVDQDDRRAVGAALIAVSLGVVVWALAARRR